MKKSPTSRNSVGIGRRGRLEVKKSPNVLNAIGIGRRGSISSRTLGVRFWRSPGEFVSAEVGGRETKDKGDLGLLTVLFGKK